MLEKIRIEHHLSINWKSASKELINFIRDSQQKQYMYKHYMNLTLQGWDDESQKDESYKARFLQRSTKDI